MIQRLLFTQVVLTIIAACEKAPPPPTREELIQERVAERIASYTKITLQRCRETVMAEASRRADSILIELARLQIDSMGIPPIPEKPVRPELLKPGDSLPVAPLFRDTFKGGSIH